MSDKKLFNSKVPIHAVLDTTSLIMKRPMKSMGTISILFHIRWGIFKREDYSYAGSNTACRVYKLLQILKNYVLSFSKPLNNDYKTKNDQPFLLYPLLGHTNGFF